MSNARKQNNESNRLFSYITYGAVAGAVVGFALAWIDGRITSEIHIAYSALVIPAMAIIGGLIAATIAGEEE